MAEDLVAAEFQRPPAQLVARFAAVATSTLANALDDFGLHDQIAVNIRPVAPGFQFAGPAVTVRETTGSYGTYSSEDFKVGVIIDAAQAGDVVVIAEDGVPYSTWGGMASLAAKTKGVSGLVVDGGVRDLEEMIEFDFPVFARHMVPTTGRGRLKVEAINVPVKIDDVVVNPGDIIVADGTGLVVVPIDVAPDLIERAEAFAADDDAALKDIKNGMSFSDAMVKFKRI